MGQKTSKGQSEEKCLLGHDKYGLNMHFAHQKDPPMNISNKYELHKPVAKKET